MSKHTPAPWSVARPSMGFSAIYGPSGELVFGLAAGGAEEKQPDDVCDANARLIAAAPDLYAALADMMFNYGDGPTRLKAYAALARARVEG